MQKLFVVGCILILFCSCGPSQRGLFGEKKSGHERYGDKIKEAGLDQTTLGNLWFAVADKSLNSPLPISIPYKETGYFASESPAATGYIFDVKRGAEININVGIVPLKPTMLYAELWKQDSDPAKSKLLSAADSTLNIKYEIEEDGKYITRLQPQLLQSFEYTLTITTVPSLAFPVSESGNPKLISFWSAPRDHGARSHEGVDISAKFRTPAIAAADGFIQRVTDNRLGGKVVFMRPEGKNYALYYAHLDTQTVATGQKVQMGDTLGLVGNTGNAKGTVPHLHFGIYALGGAVDPLPFINPKRNEPKAIMADTKYINKWMRITKTGEAVKVIGASGNSYRILYPNGTEELINNNATTEKLLKKITTDSTAKLFDKPSLAAASKTTVAPGTQLNVLGSYGDFHLTEFKDILGWIILN